MFKKTKWFWFLLGIVAPISVVISGWVFATMWGWFVVPVFGLPTLRIVDAVGFFVILSLFSSGKQRDDRDFLDIAVDMIIYALVYPFALLGIGWIVWQFV